MQALGNKLKERWAALAPREKQAVSIGGSLLLIFIVYQFIWMPSLQSVDDLRQHIKTDQKNLVWMQEADKELQQLNKQNQGKRSSMTPAVLLAAVKKKIVHAGLENYLTQLKQTTNDSIEIHFQKVEFDKLVDVLMQISKQEQVAISRWSVTVVDNAPGLVNADMVIRSES